MAETETQEIVVDFGKICRLCLSDDGVLIDIYASNSFYENSINTISERIQDLMSIAVSKDDGFPSWICHICLSQVDKCYEFFEMCRTSQITLNDSYIKALSDAGVNVSTIQSYLSGKENFKGEEVFEVIVTEEDWQSSLPELKEEPEINFKDKSNDDLHEEEICDEKFFCRDCTKIFKDKNELLVHRISVHHDDLVTETTKLDSTGNKVTGLWTCDACGAKFRSRTAISTHIRCQHLNNEKEPSAYFKKLVFCKYCGSSFSRTNINRHLEIVHRLTKTTDFDQADVGSFDCRICYRPFMRHSSLRNHIEKFHGDSLEMIAEAENCAIVWNCNECDLLFPEEVFLMQHYGSKHSKYPLEVDSLRVLKNKELICECGVISSNAFDLSIHDVFYHAEQKSKGTLVECPACEASFSVLLELKKHLISYHWFVATNSDNECTFCGGEFESNDSLRIHLHGKHDISFEKIPIEEKLPKEKMTKETTDVNEESKMESAEELSLDLPQTKVELTDDQPKLSLLFCDMCNGCFESNEDLVTHQESCQNNHTCHLCNKTYKTDNHLKRHIVEYHNTMSPIKCPLCPKVFPRKMNLHNHYKRRHLKQTKKFVCSYCGQSLKGKVALRSHEDRLHRNIRSFKCPECPEAFTTRSILRKHEQRHMAERPMLKCQYCEREFSTISGIERHVKTHEGVKDFVCELPLCGKSFYTKSELKRHIKFHNRDFRHVCPTCNHKFMSPGELKKHSTKHTGERPFKCHLCNSAYSRRDDKVKHLKRVHNLRVKRIYGKPLRKYSDDETETVDTIIIDDGCTEEVTLGDEIVYADIDVTTVLEST